MICVYITAIICATITALAFMFYDLRRRKITAADRRTKTRTIEKEVFVEVPVFQSCGQIVPDPAELPEKPKNKGSFKGYYVGKDGDAQPITGRSGKHGKTE